MPLAVIVVFAALRATQPLPDFDFRDADGGSIRFSTFAENRVAVLIFLGVDCPLANLYAPRLAELAQRHAPAGVRFLALDPLPADGTTAVGRFTREHRLPFPMVKDPDGRIAEICRATRSPQVVVLDRSRRVRYRGRIDDQYEPGGKNRGQPTRNDLNEAIR
jgi:peroxiredoxin